MVNLPDSLYEDYSKLKFTSSTDSSSSVPVTTLIPPANLDMIFQWINDLRSPNVTITNLALQNLVDNKDNFEVLPLLLWHSIGTVSIMLREVNVAFRLMTHPAYSNQLIPTRVYNVLLLFQCIAYHPETRCMFLKAKLPHYFYPLMDISYTDRPLECIRIAALGVIAHLLKPADEVAIRFLMDSGAFLYCTKPIEIGSTDSKTLAVFILNKIMSTDAGLQYCCVLADRFFVIDGLLKNLLTYLASMDRPSSTLFNLIVACYARLSQKSRARDGLRIFPPTMLFDGTFTPLLAEDLVTYNNWKQLIQNLENKA